MPKKPFSGKQKKEQLKAKRIERAERDEMANALEEAERLRKFEKQDHEPLVEVYPVARDLSELHAQADTRIAGSHRKNKRIEDQFNWDRIELEKVVVLAVSLNLFSPSIFFCFCFFIFLSYSNINQLAPLVCVLIALVALVVLTLKFCRSGDLMGSSDPWGSKLMSSGRFGKRARRSEAWACL